MEKKFKFLKISLVDVVFRFENEPEAMAEGIFKTFENMVFPIFPDNGAEHFNRVQEKRRKEWLYRFLKKLRDKIDEWITKNS